MYGPLHRSRDEWNFAYTVSYGERTRTFRPRPHERSGVGFPRVGVTNISSLTVRWFSAGVRRVTHVLRFYRTGFVSARRLYGRIYDIYIYIDAVSTPATGSSSGNVYQECRRRYAGRVDRSRFRFPAIIRSPLGAHRFTSSSAPPVDIRPFGTTAAGWETAT